MSGRDVDADGRALAVRPGHLRGSFAVGERRRVDDGVGLVAVVVVAVAVGDREPTVGAGVDGVDDRRVRDGGVDVPGLPAEDAVPDGGGRGDEDDANPDRQPGDGSDHARHVGERDVSDFGARGDGADPRRSRGRARPPPRERFISR